MSNQFGNLAQSAAPTEVLARKVRKKVRRTGANRSAAVGGGPSILRLDYVSRFFPFEIHLDVIGPSVLTAHYYDGAVFVLVGENHAFFGDRLDKTDWETIDEEEKKKRLRDREISKYRDLQNYLLGSGSPGSFLLNLFANWESAGIPADFYMEYGYSVYDYGTEGNVYPSAEMFRRPSDSLAGITDFIYENRIRPIFKIKGEQGVSDLSVQYHLCDIRQIVGSEKLELETNDPVYWEKLLDFTQLGNPGTPFGFPQHVAGILRWVENRAMISSSVVQEAKRRKLKFTMGPDNVEAHNRRRFAELYMELVVNLTYLDFCYHYLSEIFHLFVDPSIDFPSAVHVMFVDNFDKHLKGSYDVFGRKTSTGNLLTRAEFSDFIQTTASYRLITEVAVGNFNLLARRKKDVLGGFLTHHKIARQIDELGPALSQKLRTFLSERAIGMGKSLREKFRNVDWVGRMNHGETWEEKQKILGLVAKAVGGAWENLGDIDTLFMDGYVLGKMLRNSLVGRKTGRTVKSAIGLVYSGSFHTQTYHAFFQSLGSAELIRSKNAQFKLHEVGEMSPSWHSPEGLSVYKVLDPKFAEFGISYAQDKKKRSQRFWQFVGSFLAVSKREMKIVQALYAKRPDLNSNFDEVPQVLRMSVEDQRMAALNAFVGMSLKNSGLVSAQEYIWDDNAGMKTHIQHGDPSDSLLGSEKQDVKEVKGRGTPQIEEEKEEEAPVKLDVLDFEDLLEMETPGSGERGSVAASLKRQREHPRPEDVVFSEGDLGVRGVNKIDDLGQKEETKPGTKVGSKNLQYLPFIGFHYPCDNCSVGEGKGALCCDRCKSVRFCSTACKKQYMDNYTKDHRSDCNFSSDICFRFQ